MPKIIDVQFLGINEKFINQTLKPHEWLTRCDIESGIQLLCLEESQEHPIKIIPFEAEQIGLAIDAVRKKHDQDKAKAKKPYTIPLMFDLGEDEYSRQNSRGSHWTRCLITVDPSKTPPTVSATYTDSLPLPKARIAQIKKDLTAGLDYYKATGSYATNDFDSKSAFPDCELTMTIKGAEEHGEGYTSGYDALLGLAQDLGSPTNLKKESSRDFFYCLLTSEPENASLLGTVATTHVNPKTMNSSINEKLIEFNKIEEDQNKDQELQAKLFDPQHIQMNNDFLKPEDIDLSALLTYIAINEDQFASFPTTTIRIVDASVESLSTLKLHLNSQQSYTPFKAFVLQINNPPDPTIESIQSLLLAANKKSIERLTLNFDKSLDVNQIKGLNQFIQDNNIETLIHLVPSKVSPEEKNAIALLENTLLRNKRSQKPSSEAPTKAPSAGPLGKVGKAIFQPESLAPLSSEVQVQQEQQQQVQQQMQSSLQMDDLPDEDTLIEESFLTYSGKDKLLTKDEFIKEMQDDPLIPAALSPERCWDLITGENSNLFKYGIQKMTLPAAKLLVRNLHDVQYGLHPDNLPRGFFLQQDADNNLVLAYDPINPPINPKESPLTIQFSKQKQPNTWGGNALQFITEQQATELYTTIFKPRLFTSKETITSQVLQQNSNFFGLSKTDTTLSIDQRLTILATFACDTSIIERIKELFVPELSNNNIAALSEILYEQNASALSGFLDKMALLKRVKGDDFFKSFKSCFIDPSKNLNELTTEASQNAIQALIAQTPAESAWWTSLTEQHTSDIKYNEPISSQVKEDFEVIAKGKPGQRWANLADLSHGFNYFCAQLLEIDSNLKLMTFCPLKNIADMRVGLDRLISTILPNAHDLNEQFYESLDGLELDPLGPFYASRYEGFKLVTPEMKLKLGSFTQDVGMDKALSLQEYCFLADKQNFVRNLSYPGIKPIQSKMLFLRYIAKFNQRAPLTAYQEAFSIILSTGSDLEIKSIQGLALTLIAAFGTGKRGRNFSTKDIEEMAKFITDGMIKDDNNVKQYPFNHEILMYWQTFMDKPIKPTLAEILAISNYIISPPNGAQELDAMEEIVTLLEQYPNKADLFVNALVTFSKNPSSLPLLKVLKTLTQLGENKVLGTLSSHAEMTAILAVCCPDGTANEAIPQEITTLFNSISIYPGRAELIELLKNIDVVFSTKLPTLNELNTLVMEISKRPPSSYNDLVQAVQTKLPEGCLIKTDSILATTAPYAGNLHTILSKQMDEILKQLTQNKAMIDRTMGPEFFDSLNTSEGPAILMNSLKKLAISSSLIGGQIQNEIIGLMRSVYHLVIKNGIVVVGSSNILSRIILQQVSHPVNTENDLTKFSTLFASELTNVEQLMSQLKAIRTKWPSQFDAILQTLGDCKKIGDYPLALLFQITKAFAQGFDSNQPFPIETFHQFFSFGLMDEVTKGNLKIIIDTLLTSDEDSSEAILSDKEKQLLCTLAIQKIVAGNIDLTAFLKNILLLKSKEPELFTLKLKLILAGQEPEEIATAIQSMNSPELKARVLTFFSGSNAKEFLTVMSCIQAIPDAKRGNDILSIVIKAAQQKDTAGVNIDTMKSIIQLMGEPLPLNELIALYASHRYPNLKQLKTALSKKLLDIEQLQKDFDRDPFTKRQTPEAIALQFNTEKVAGLIDKMRDLNHDRPLLLTQRQQLQRWFLYINAIGNNRPILTREGKQSAVKDLSHAEIKNLLDHYRTLAHPKSDKVQLEAIAMLREVMFRATGNFPRPTQVLYLLSAMHQGGNFIAQIPTGQGKSLTSAMAAAMMSLNGKTVDVTSSNLSLASESLSENQEFFNYLDIHTGLISAESSKDEDYRDGGIYYSSMSDIALYRSKMDLQGKLFPVDTVLIADEVDFSTLDDNTRYRFAKTLDAVTDQDKSPYTWAYEALIRFADAQDPKVSQSEEKLIQDAKQWLTHSAKSSKEKALLLALEENQKIYLTRLETWLIAAGRTKQLIEQEGTTFRRVDITHKRKGTISKACILANGRPSIQAEYSAAVQQFLHVRLRERYQADIKAGTMPDFLVEPEKTYVSTLNSKILMSKYQLLLGMTGTAGSTQEIQEQHEKYGFRFVDIPPHVSSQRVDLKPMLTHKKYQVNKGERPEVLNNKRQQSANDHIKKIVDDVIRHINNANPSNTSSPMLIICPDKAQGEKIKAEINRRFAEKNPRPANLVQSYYSSEKATPEERNQEESEVKEKAGQNGMITISTVFGRGTDIKPKHQEGLYTVKTYVDTQPYSAEDLERAKRQELGRSARGEQKGYARMIVDRNQFAELNDIKIDDTNQSLDAAIRALNHERNLARVVDRDLRESFDDVKEQLNQQFTHYIQAVNKSAATSTQKTEMRDTILMEWSDLLKSIDERWETLQHEAPDIGNTDKLSSIVHFGLAQWTSLKNRLPEDIKSWVKRYNLTITLPEMNPLIAEDMVLAIRKKFQQVCSHYVKGEQLNGALDSTVSSDHAYCQIAETQQCGENDLENIQLKEISTYLSLLNARLNTPSYRKALESKRTLIDNLTSHENNTQKTKRLMGALLYLRYKAYRDGNPLAYSELSQQCRDLTLAVINSKILDLKTDLADAHQEHFSKLTSHQGNHEHKKIHYLHIIMAESNQHLRAENDVWKQVPSKNNLKSIKETFAKTLTSYCDSPWTRSFVSNDRKKIARILIECLNNTEKTSLEIIEALSQARKQMLENDLTHKRPINAGLHGRLNQTIETLKAQVMAASDSKTVDSFATNEFTDIKNTLKEFSNRIEYEPLEGIIQSMDIDRILTPDEIKNQYHALSKFFADVEGYAANPKLLKDETIRSLATYCKEKQTQLVYYFRQCDSYKDIAIPQSVAVFRAAILDASTLINASAISSKNENTGQDIQYRNQTIQVKVTASLLNSENAFKRIIRDATYQSLLSKIEKEIIESSQNPNSKVQFLKLSLEKSEDMSNNILLQLMIELMVDDNLYTVGYLVNMKTGLVYSDTQVQASVEPDVEEIGPNMDSIERELLESQNAIAALTVTTDAVLKSISSMQAFKVRLQEGVGSKTPTTDDNLFPKRKIK